MIELIKNGVYLAHGRFIIEDAPGLSAQKIFARIKREGMEPPAEESLSPGAASRGTITHRILAAHHQGGGTAGLKLRFDALASHDITYVGIIQSARAGGLREFPVPYILTNCHNSLCAVGGTINEDDHLFGLSAARKYGGIFVPAHDAVIHQYVRETMAGCGRMILGSDSHTRYGALGTLGVGEGGPELVKQLLGRPFELAYPDVIAVFLTGAPRPGVGPQDVALALIREVFADGLAQNKVLEFVGPGIDSLSMDFRNGVDVMTTETACLSSVWRTDGAVRKYLEIHGRPEAFQKLEPESIAHYDGLIRVDLSKIEPMIALPFHPSNAFPIRELTARAPEILAQVEEEAGKSLEGGKASVRLRDKISGGRLLFHQGVIAGCAGGSFENLWIAAQTLDHGRMGPGSFSLSVYPASKPILMELIRTGAVEKLTAAGATVKTAFCGPCFGAGDVPANDTISARHTTRNFPNREGSRPGGGQIAYVALMDARSIAATARRGGLLTAATELDELPLEPPEYRFDERSYGRVYRGFGRPMAEEPLRLGPNIADWPRMSPLPENLALKVISVIHDPVTTTDELIPSGETSSFRSNPAKLAEFTLSRRDPGYVGRAAEVHALEAARAAGAPASLPGLPEADLKRTGIASAIVVRKPGDGSAREQAASCQRVLGGLANIAVSYATKRYRGNLINWGLLPFTAEEKEFLSLAVNDIVYLPGLRKAISEGASAFEGVVSGEGPRRTIRLALPGLSEEERRIILSGCLINTMSA